MITPAPDLLLSDLIRRCPNIDRIAAYRLSETWSTLHRRIIHAMFDICERDVGLVLNVDHRADAAFELAKLSLFLQQRILDEKAKAKPLDQYDPAVETALSDTPSEKNRIENTAHALAEGVWKPLVAKWRKGCPLIEAPDQPGRRPKLHKPIKTEFRRDMHYVPQSTTRPWACRKSGKFTVYKMGVDGEVRHKPSTAKAWGKASFIYSQGLEHLLGLIEGDVRRPYEKLVSVIPLDDMETRCWIAFLVAQHIRTPRFIRWMVNKQKTWIERSDFRYPTNPAHLGRAFETLFQNNDVYAAYFRLISAGTWHVVRAAEGLTFLKGDNPAVITGSTSAGTWSLIYPLTPERCFIAGPGLEDEQGRIVPRQHQLSDRRTLEVNAAICAYAETSVIGVKEHDRIDPKPTIKAHLPKRVHSQAVDAPFWGLASVSS
jgi:Protein of unknown function (DUF4238)